MTNKPFFWPSGARAAVSLTFDDARPSQLDAAIPILDAHGAKGSFYVTINPMVKRLEEWRRAAASGHEIGNHTLHHPCSGNFLWSREHALEDYTLEQMEDEVTEVNAMIEEAIGTAPLTFAYPCGQRFVGRGDGLRSYIPVIGRHFAAGRGFGDEYLNDPAYCDLAQVGARDADNVSFERLKMYLEQAVADGQWLILVAHEVGAIGHQTMCADALTEFCGLVTAPDSGVWVDTVANIAEYIQKSRA